VIGVGLDAEWYKTTDSVKFVAVSDADAARWVTLARSFNPSYTVFLKHYDPNYLPQTYRDGIVFVDDSENVGSATNLMNDFKAFAQRFSPAPLAFQFGYPSDKSWWSAYADPPKTIGDMILNAIPNTVGLFWVDFSMPDIWPLTQ
jgi:hypothetical protein